MKCVQCSISDADIRDPHPEDYFVGAGTDVVCTTCLALMSYLDQGHVGRTRATDLVLAANRARRKTEDRLRLAEDCASLFRDHLAGCVDTARETDALTEWEYAAGVKPVPDTADDYPRAEDMA